MMSSIKPCCVVRATSLLTTDNIYRSRNFLLIHYYHAAIATQNWAISNIVVNNPSNLSQTIYEIVNYGVFSRHCQGLPCDCKFMVHFYWCLVTKYYLSLSLFTKGAHMHMHIHAFIHITHIHTLALLELQT